MKLGNPATLLILIQVLILIGGSLAVTGLMKINGYDPESEIFQPQKWPLIARTIRGWGMLGLLIPIASLILVYRSQASNSSVTWQILAITICLGCLYGLGILSSISPPRLGPIQQMTFSETTERKHSIF